MNGALRLPRSLYGQVLLAVVLGIAVGALWPEFGAALKPIGDAFIKLVKMMIAPIIFCTVVLGITGMEDLRSVGRTGALALIYFEVVSTIALVLGLLMVNLLQPGAGMNIDPATLDAGSVVQYVEQGKAQTIKGFLLDIIPSNLLGALVGGELLPVLLVALLTGFALHGLGGPGHGLRQLVASFSALLFRILGYVMRLAPIGAFGAMAFTIGKYGVGTLLSLGKLMACFYGTCLLFIGGVLGLIARLHGFSLWRLIRALREELFIVLGTSSSESVLPRLMTKLEDFGAAKQVVGLVVPTGYSFNLDGTAIYLTMAAVFIAQATNTPLDLTQQLVLLGVLLLTSKGAAGVTGSGFIVLAATLGAVGHVPVAGVALILGIDRFMSEARALTNLIGNTVATLVVARWCGQLDEGRLRRRLDPEQGGQG